MGKFVYKLFHLKYIAVLSQHLHILRCLIFKILFLEKCEEDIEANVFNFMQMLIQQQLLFRLLSFTRQLRPVNCIFPSNRSLHTLQIDAIMSGMLIGALGCALLKVWATAKDAQHCLPTRLLKRAFHLRVTYLEMWNLVVKRDKQDYFLHQLQ